MEATSAGRWLAWILEDLKFVDRNGGLALALAAKVISRRSHRPFSRDKLIRILSEGQALTAEDVAIISEGLGIDWPGQDLALLLFAALFLGAGLIGASLARKLRVEFA